LSASRKNKKTEFSSVLKKLLENKGILQKELADLCGVTQASVSGWMNGATPNSDKLTKLASVLAVSVEQLLGMDTDTRIRMADSAAVDSGGDNRVFESEMSRYQAKNYQELYFVEKAAREKLEKRLERVHKGLIKMVEQLGGAE
jgi:transcriptional regulator with XRE-family HTH domain